MGCLGRALREVEHEKHIACKTKTITKLLNGNAYVHPQQILRLIVGSEDIYTIRYGDCADHGPQPTSEAASRYAYTAYNAS